MTIRGRISKLEIAGGYDAAWPLKHLSDEQLDDLIDSIAAQMSEREHREFEREYPQLTADWRAMRRR